MFKAYLMFVFVQILGLGFTGALAIVLSGYENPAKTIARACVAFIATYTFTMSAGALLAIVSEYYRETDPGKSAAYLYPILYAYSFWAVLPIYFFFFSVVGSWMTAPFFGVVHLTKNHGK